MAIFGPVDRASVPALTQFYQLAVDPENLIGGELDRWLSGVILRDVPCAALPALADLHPLLVRILDAIADDTMPAPDDARAINEKIVSSMALPRLEWLPIGPAETERTRLLNVVPGGSRANVPPYVSLLLQNFLAAVARPDALWRCDACRSVFVESRARPVQRFCSHRCAHRIGTRRRRAEEKLCAYDRAG